jgi:hypothetical protein
MAGKKARRYCTSVEGGRTVNRLIVVVGLGALGAGCGSDPIQEQPPGSTCAQVHGKFVLHSHLIGSTGTCTAAPARPWVELQFTDGQMESPVGDLLNCTTSQADCAVNVTCSATFMKALIKFDGMLSKDGASILGEATAEGNYQGCTSVTYNVSVYAEAAK